MQTIPQIFNFNKLQKNKDRASKYFLQKNFIFEEINSRILERITEIDSNYDNILLIGFTCNEFLKQLKRQYTSSNIYVVDISHKFLNLADEAKKVVSSNEILPFKEKSFDLIIGSLHCSFVNDLPGLLIQAKNTLKENGVFMANFFTSENLYELKESLKEAEIKVKGGFSPRIAPLIDIKSLASLLQKFQYNEPVTDADKIKVQYSNVTDLMHDLRFNALNNCLDSKIGNLNKEIIAESDEIYKSNFGDGEGGIIATFNIVNIIGIA